MVIVLNKKTKYIIVANLSNEDLVQWKNNNIIEKLEFIVINLMYLHFNSSGKYLRWIIQKEKEEIFTIRFIK